jgi:hypothetical protein
MSTKQVKVHADGCTPAALELRQHDDQVVFIQSDPKAPTTVHVDNHALFGTTTCSVAATAAEATAYTARAVGNYTIGLTPGTGLIQVLCLPSSQTARGVSGTGSIKVTG